MENKILELLKKYDKIVIARHIGGDPDALGSTFALKEIILENFPNKNVYVVGASISKFRFFGSHDKVNDELIKDSLLIALDVPDIRRIDGVNFYDFKDVIKIDHHPEIDKFSNYELIKETASSTCEIIASFCKKCNLSIPHHAAENLFMGIIADTNRFLFSSNNSATYKIVSELIEEQKIEPNKLYGLLYKRSISEVRLEGLISLNMKITKHGVGYIKITDSDLKSINASSASVGSIMNNYNFIDEVVVWIVFTEDLKSNVIRTSARSRGPIINKLFEQYNGGGHLYACGAKLQGFNEADEIIDKLDDLCMEYCENKS